MNEPKTVEAWGEISIGDLEEIGEHHFKLCQKLHNLMDSLPVKIQEEIRDDVYKYFEP